MNINYFKITSILFLSAFIISCTTTPTVSSRETESKREIETKYDLKFHIYDSVGRLISGSGVNEKTGERVALISVEAICEKIKVEHRRTISHMSDGSTRTGSWRKFVSEEDKEKCPVDYRDVSLKDGGGIFDIEFIREGDFPVITIADVSLDVYVGQYFLKTKKPMVYFNGHSIDLDENNFTRGIGTAPLLEKKTRLIADYKGIRKESNVSYRVVDKNHVVKLISEKIKNNHFKKINISTLDIDSHYPFFGSKITISGNTPSINSLVSNYVEDSSLKRLVTNELDINYVKGTSCCGNQMTVFYPANYELKM